MRYANYNLWFRADALDMTAVTAVQGSPSRLRDAASILTRSLFLCFENSR